MRSFGSAKLSGSEDVDAIPLYRRFHEKVEGRKIVDNSEDLRDRSNSEVVIVGWASMVDYTKGRCARTVKSDHHSD